MLKALIVGADSVSPDLLFHNLELFPALKHLVKNGASAAYSAYVQKGYQGSYSSEQNWASIYTGLSPSVHGINTYNVHMEKRRPEMKDFNNLNPFWQVLNEHGLRVGLWAADSLVSPQPIHGYAVSAYYQMISTPTENRKAPRSIQLCEKDMHIAKYLDGAPPARQYPKTLKQQGYSFEELKQNPMLAEQAVRNYCFEDALPNFKEELAYWFQGMKKVQKETPVDVLYLYTPTTDLIAHCCYSCPDNPVLLKAYQILDNFIGQCIQEFQPENMVFLSDHGQQNFKNLICSKDIQIQKEAFAARNEVLWLKNGFLAFEAHNGALLFTAHGLKGTFIISGPGVKHTSVQDMRTLDIYPTLLELLSVKIPAGRSGYAMDIFEHQIVNTDYTYPIDLYKENIALIQSHSVNITDIILNELYIENRFADITVVGESRFREVFLGNPRVKGFIPFEEFNKAMFDKIYCCICNADTNYMNHLQIVSKAY